jgi:hypothetical protein
MPAGPLLRGVATCWNKSRILARTLLWLPDLESHREPIHSRGSEFLNASTTTIIDGDASWGHAILFGKRNTGGRGSASS